MTGVRVKEGESFENAMKRFKKACEKAGILSEIRKREHYEKPSVKRKKKALAAKKRALKKSAQVLLAAAPGTVTMALREQLDEDLKSAMRAKDSLRMNTVRALKSAIKYREIELMKPLDDAGILGVMATEIKRRRDSVEQYRAGNRAGPGRQGRGRDRRSSRSSCRQQLTQAEVEAKVDEVDRPGRRAGAEGHGRGHEGAPAGGAGARRRQGGERARQATPGGALRPAGGARPARMIPDSIIEEIRNRTDVVAVIGRHVELQRSGRTWKGCCPFHGERTPSFHVYPEDKHFKCYGCGEYGDVFKFLQKLEGKEFPEVVRALAAEVGVEIPEETVEDTAEARRRRKERAEALAACDAAARYWQARLWSPHGEAGRAYLASRGISEEESRRFRLGIVAPTSGTTCRRGSTQKEISLASIDKAGLRVAERPRAATTASAAGSCSPSPPSTGRSSGSAPGPWATRRGPSTSTRPETVLYKKSRVLYGLDLARESIRKTRSAVLVEGYFDVIGLHQAGVKNAVAVCGTALTPEHVELLERCDCREVVILFDGDLAGLAAPAKAAQVLLPSGRLRQGGRAAVRAPARWTPTTSPGPTARRGSTRCSPRPSRSPTSSSTGPWSDTARAARPTPRWRPSWPRCRELAPLVRLAPEGLARTIFEERIARRLELDLQALRERDPGSPPRRGRPGAGARSARPAAARAARASVLLPGPAVDALGILAGHPGLGPVAAEEDLARLFPEGPLADLVRDLCRDPIPLEDAAGPARAGRRRPRRAAGPGPGRPGRPPRRRRRAGAPPRRRRGQASRPSGASSPASLALVARAGSPAAEDLTREQLTLQRRRQDLEKRREELRRP